jgi:hypothetical protein
MTIKKVHRVIHSLLNSYDSSDNFRLKFYFAEMAHSLFFSFSLFSRNTLKQIAGNEVKANIAGSVNSRKSRKK